MSKSSDLSHYTAELRKCGETIVNLSKELVDFFNNFEEENQPVKMETTMKLKQEKAITLEDVRAVCADKSRSGFTAEIKTILGKHGAEKLSEINPVEYKALLAEVEVLGNAG